jgi:hypothetical protein
MRRHASPVRPQHQRAAPERRLLVLSRAPYSHAFIIGVKAVHPERRLGLGLFDKGSVLMSKTGGSRTLLMDGMLILSFRKGFNLRRMNGIDWEFIWNQ